MKEKQSKYMPLEQWRIGQQTMLTQLETNLTAMRAASGAIDDELTALENKRAELVKRQQGLCNEYKSTFRAAESIRNNLGEL